jgi:hypothetical protein
MCQEIKVFKMAGISIYQSMLYYHVLCAAAGPGVRGGNLHPCLLHVRPPLHRHQQLPQLRRLFCRRSGVQKNISSGTQIAVVAKDCVQLYCICQRRINTVLLFSGQKLKKNFYFKI